MSALRVLVRLLAGLLVLTVVLVVALVAHGWSLVDLKQRRRVPEFHAATDSAAIARGRHLVEISCAGCHSTTSSPPLAGSGMNFLQVDTTRSLGTLWGPNLTPASAAGRASDGQLARAIREGIGVDGRAMLIMPSGRFRSMSDEDLASVIGYLRSERPVERELPPRSLGIMPYLIIGLHQFPVSVQPEIKAAVAHVPAAESVDYGKYLASLATCEDCHGESMRGVPPNRPGPRGPALADSVGSIEFATFDRALRGGIGFRGQALNPAEMPFAVFRNMTELEARAIFTWLQSLKAH